MSHRGMSSTLLRRIHQNHEVQAASNGTDRRSRNPKQFAVGTAVFRMLGPPEPSAGFPLRDTLSSHPVGLGNSPTLRSELDAPQGAFYGKF